MVSSPDLAKEIIKTHDMVFANRPQNRAVKIILYGCKDIGFANYGEDWRRKRKICVLQLLSLKSVQSFKFIREEEGQDLVNEIREACESSTNGGSLNLSEILMAASNNLVCRCFYGKKYNTKDSDGKFGELARRAVAQISASSVGDLFPSLRWLDAVTGLVQDFKATFKELDAFLDQVIAEHKNGQHSEEKKKDFVDILLQLQGSGMLDFELTQDDIKAILVVCLSITLSI